MKEISNDSNQESAEKCRILALEAFSSDAYLTVNKHLLSHFGPNVTVFLSNLIDKYRYFLIQEKLNGDGSFFLTHEDQIEQTGMSEYDIRKCKKILMEKGIISTYMSGLPPKEFYLLNIDNLINNYCRNIPLNFKGIRVKNLKELGFKFYRNINNNKYNNNKLQEEQIDSENNKLFSSSISVAPKNGATVSDKKNEIYYPIIEKLGNIITSKKRINIDGRKKSSWANSVRQLCENDGVEPARIETALDWYERHHMDEYVPVIESGKSLREKFLKLEAAIERSKTQRRSRTVQSGYSDLEPLTYKKPKIV